MEYLIKLKVSMTSAGLNDVQNLETKSIFDSFENVIHKVLIPAGMRGKKKLSGKQLQKIENKLFIGNIPFSASANHLWDFFSKFGQVVDAVVIKDKRSRRLKGFGFVSFSNKNEVTRVLNAAKDELTLKGRIMNAARAEPKKSKDLFGEIKMENPTKVTYLEIKPSIFINNNRSETSLIDLNDDVMETIFSHLPPRDLSRMNAVCKKWNTILISIWKQKKTLDLSYFNIFKGTGLTNRILSILLSKTQKGLTTLNLRRHSTLGFFALQMVGKLCPNLTSLDMSGMVVTEANIMIFSKLCPGLEILTAIVLDKFNEKSAWRLLHGLQKLRVLNLSENRCFTGRCFKQAGPLITNLDLTNCKSLLSVGVGLAIQHCTALTHLSISGCSSLDLSVASHLLGSKLIHLKMSGHYPHITQPMEFAKIGKINTLVDVNVAFNDLVSDIFMNNLSSASNLTHVNVSGCNGRNSLGVTDAGLKYIKNVTHLHISYLAGVSDAGLKHFSSSMVLNTVELCGSPLITNSGVDALLSCPSLSWLDLSGCQGITSMLIPLLVDKRCVMVGMGHLEVYLGGTLAREEDCVISKSDNVMLSKTLSIQTINRCIDRLRPDYMDYINYGIIFSESDEEEDDDDGWSHSTPLDDSWNSDDAWGEYDDDNDDLENDLIQPQLNAGNDNDWPDWGGVEAIPVQNNEVVWEGGENWEDEE